jgi:hypothetical protein
MLGRSNDLGGGFCRWGGYVAERGLQVSVKLFRGFLYSAEEVTSIFRLAGDVVRVMSAEK